MFGERVKELRLNNGWTQQEFGNMLGVTKQTVANWENSNVMPSIELLIKMSGLFRVTTDYLLELETDLTIKLPGITDLQKEMLFRMLQYFDLYDDKHRHE